MRNHQRCQMGGKILKVNGDLENKPELVNEDCYGKAWMVVIQPSNSAEATGLMDPKAYREHLKAAAH